VVVFALVVLGLLVWAGAAGATLLLDAWWRRRDRPRRMALLTRPLSLGADAQSWLDNQN
jgi:hypothetical protein